MIWVKVRRTGARELMNWRLRINTLELAKPPTVTVATFDEGLAKTIRDKKTLAK